MMKMPRCAALLLAISLLLMGCHVPGGSASGPNDTPDILNLAPDYTSVRPSPEPSYTALPPSPEPEKTVQIRELPFIANHGEHFAEIVWEPSYRTYIIINTDYEIVYMQNDDKTLITISEIGDGILEIADYRGVGWTYYQYYDPYADRFSRVYEGNKIAAAYGMIARIDWYSDEPGNNDVCLIVNDIFDEEKFTFMAERDFQAFSLPYMAAIECYFINDKELYLEYYTERGGASEREVIRFKDE